MKEQRQKQEVFCLFLLLFFNGICGQKMAGGTNATEFKIRRAYQIGGESFHGQVTSLTPRCLTIRQENTCATYSHRVW